MQPTEDASTPTLTRPRRRHAAVAAVVAALLSIGAAPPHANGSGPKKVGSIQEFVAPFEYAWRMPDPDPKSDNAPSCDDGGGTLNCTVEATADKAGALSASATLRPADALALANAGHAQAWGLAGEVIRIPSGLTQIDLTATFEVDWAEASSSLASYSAVHAVISAGHGGCSSCEPLKGNARLLYAMAGTFSSSEDRPVTVTISMTPPAGHQTIPKGWIVMSGSLHAIANTVGTAFTGEASASVRGRLTALTVEYVS